MVDSPVDVSIELSVVIVSWNVRDLLRRCVQSIFKFQVSSFKLEVIVVDNASSDGSAEMVRSEFPQVRLVANGTNRGFTGGNNDGLAIARGRYVMLLNPDTQVLDDALATLVTYADAHPQIGALGPQLIYPDGSIQSSRRRFPSLCTALFESTWLQSLAPPGLLKAYYALDLPDDQAAEVDWLMGAALLVRREVVEQVGVLDEGFFMYSEELDWCKRIKDAGWQIVYLPEARVIHHEGKSSEQVAPQRHVYFQTSKVRYFRKHHGKLAAGVLRIYLLALYAWQVGLEAAKWAIGHKRELRRERVRAYLNLLRSGLDWR
ncbi:MAG: glycosyltransferase family 2 protein [Thermoflexales bacterium]|nr:glycosyltransferase family 2 protein [Thermoflexales bacterium]